MKIIKGTRKGFFGNVLDVARHISHCVPSGELWYVDWNDTLYNDTNKGPNAWEYYFLNNHKLNLDGASIVQDYTSLNLIPNLNFRQTMNFVICNYIQVNSFVLSKLNFILNKFNISSKTLGIHIRKTDKHNPTLWGEPKSATPLDVSFYVKYLQKYINNFENVFIASDDTNDLNYLSSFISHNFNKKVIYLEALRSFGNVSIHNNFFEISGYKKGLEVLLDVLILSNCGHLIRSTSNVGSTAQFLNLNLTHTNINEIEAGDCREQEYNLYSIKHFHELKQ